MATLFKGYYTFVNNLNFMAQVLSESFDFKCDNVSYTSMNWDDVNGILEYNATNVYDENNGGWLDNKYKKILVETDQSVSATMETLITINSSFGFTLSYDVDGGTPITSHTSVSYLQASDLPTAVKPHYSFVGWYYENTFTTQVQVGDLIDSNTTIYAKFNELYSVHFDTDGGTAVTDLVDVTTITSLPVTTKTGYTFLGWFYVDNTQAQVGDLVTENITLYAHWQEIYDVIFDTDGGTAVSNLIDVTTITSLPTTTKQGYTFGGWFYDLDYTNQAHVGDSVTHNTILFAKWTFTGTFYLNLYKNRAEDERVDKYDYLANATKLDIYALQPSSIQNPVIDIQYSGVLNFNYANIPLWNRFYYITNIVVLRTNLYRISLKCDVLMSFKNDILNSNALISRQQYDYNDYLVDEKIPTQNNNNIEVIDITTDARIKSTTTSAKPFVVEIGGKIN